jgi:LuxR family maltose regulon positive regulatory protein
VLIAQGLLDEAVSLLERLARSAETGGRNGRLIEILVLQAMALHAQNRVTRALTVLEKALSLAEPEGYVRVFVDEGPPMVALLRQAASRSIVPGYTNRLLAVLGEEPRGTAKGKPIPALIEPLSERELEVLRLVADGLSNQEIADALILTVGTVKAHVHNIYGKLSVRGRTQAIALARELHLL